MAKTKFKYPDIGKKTGATLTDQEIKGWIEDINKKWKQGKKNRSDKEKGWIANFMSYKKQNSIFFFDNGELQEVNLNYAKEKKLGEMTTNRIYPVVRDLEAQIDSARPLFSAEITNHRVQEFDAKTQEAMAARQYEEMEDTGIIDQQRIRHITCGNSVYRVNVNEKNGDWVCLRSSEEVINTGKIEVDIVPIFDWVADDSYGDFKKSGWGIQRHAIRKHMAERNWPGVKFQYMRTSKDMIDYSTGNSYNDGDEIVFIYEFIKKADETDPYGLTIHTDGTQMLTFERNNTPGKKKNDIGSQLPWVHKKAVETTDLEGESVLSYARPAMKEYNLRRKQMADHMRRLGNPKMVIDRRAKYQDEMMGSDKVTIVRANLRESHGAQYIQGAEMSQGYKENMMLIKDDMESITGVKPFQSLGTRTPAQSLMVQREVAMMGNALLIKRFYLGVEDVLNLCLDFMRDYYDEVREIEYFDGEDYIYADYIGTRLDKNIKIRIRSTFGLSDNKVFRQQQLERLLALRAITPEKFKELLQFGELDKALNSETWNKIRASMENAKITQNSKTGKPTRLYVDIYENHLVHIEKHRGRLMKGDMFITPDMSKEDIERIGRMRTELYVHIDYHWYAIGILLTKNIMMAGMVLDMETMNQARMALFQMSIQQIQKTTQDMETKVAGYEKRQPRNIAETDFAALAQGLGAVAPQVKQVQALQGAMDNQLLGDMMNQINQNAAPDAMVGAEGV